MWVEWSYETRLLKLPVMFLEQFYVRGHLVLLSVEMIPTSL